VKRASLLIVSIGFLATSAHSQIADWSQVPGIAGGNFNGKDVTYLAPVGNDKTVDARCGVGLELPCAGGGYGQVGIPIYYFATARSVFDLQQSMSNLNSNYMALSGRVSGLENAVSQLGTSISLVRREERRGIAGALAMSSAPMPSAPGRTSWTVNTADFMGKVAVGFSIAHRFNTRVPFAMTAGYSATSDRTGLYRFGLAGEF
jgi:autotransporter adhesin